MNSITTSTTTRRIQIGERTWSVEVRSSAHPVWIAVRFELIDGPVLGKRRRTVWRSVHRTTGRWAGGGERRACRRYAPELEAALADVAQRLGVLELDVVAM